MATKAAQIFPSEIKYWTVTKLPDGSSKRIQTAGQSPETTQVQYCYGTAENAQGVKTDPFPFDQAVIATQFVGGLDWNHEYPPLGFCQAPEVTQSFRPDDKPNIHFFYRVEPSKPV